jgi:hypothetical protein
MATQLAPQPSANASPRRELSLAQLYLLRSAYLVLGGGLAVVKWPLLLHRDQPWTLMGGVVNSMLAALSVLALLGLRYPVRMLPVLLFESAWKLIWLMVVALPLWTAHRLDPATREVAVECLPVVIILAAIPWRYVVAEYLTQRSDRWRPQP